MKYRKKPVVIEAFQMTEDVAPRSRFMRECEPWPKWLHEAWRDKVLYWSEGGDHLAIQTPEGDHQVSWDDFIIQGIQGELYPCKPDIFHATYEAV